MNSSNKGGKGVKSRAPGECRKKSGAKKPGRTKSAEKTEKTKKSTDGRHKKPTKSVSREFMPDTPDIGKPVSDVPEKPDLQEKREPLTAAQNDKLLSMLGFAARARKLDVYTEQVIMAIRHNGRPDGRTSNGVVIISADASANTKKRIKNACGYYNVECFQSDISSAELSRRIGKSSDVSAVSTFDGGFSGAIKKIICRR